MDKWRRSAACIGLGPEMFFPGGEDTEEGSDNQGTEGKQVCADCSIVVECLDYAVRTQQRHGIWGGVGKDRRDSLRVFYVGGDPILYQRALAAEIAELGRVYAGHEDERPITAERPCPRCGSPIPRGRHPVDRNGRNATCGKASTYNKGCRCSWCVSAKADYHRERKQVKRARLLRAENEAKVVLQPPENGAKMTDTATRPDEMTTIHPDAAVIKAAHPMGDLFTSTSFDLPKNLSFDDWSKAGEPLLAVAEGIQWWIGDWSLYGDVMWGEDSYQAIDPDWTGIENLANRRWVSSAFARRSRFKDLSWTHHRIAAKLPTPGHRREGMLRARKDVLLAGSTRKFEAVINEMKAEVDPSAARTAGATERLGIKWSVPRDFAAEGDSIMDMVEELVENELESRSVPGPYNITRMK